MIRYLLLFVGTTAVSHAFIPTVSLVGIKPLFGISYSYDDIADVGYAVSVAKPLGVVFGENENPFGGLVVDDVEPGMNGGSAGLRVGDQLLAVNGKSMVGASFDSVMSDLVASDGDLELQLYRGSIRSLYVILLNQQESSKPSTVKRSGNDDDDDFVVMDENYESPVVIDVSQFEDKPLTPGDVLKAFKKIGSMITEGDGAAAATPKIVAKPKGGLFGLFGGDKQEDFFLDDDDASSLSRGGKRK